MTMETVNIFIAIGGFIISALLGTGGGILYYKSTKKGKELENEKTVANMWENFANKMEAAADAKQEKIDLLYRELREEQRSHIATQKELSTSKVECERLKWNKCIKDCGDREPPRKLAN